MPRRKQPAVDVSATGALSRPYRDAEAFLRAVALGDEPATLAQRIRAAGMLLRAGAPISALPPKERARRDALVAERDALKEWHRVSAAIRAKHGRPS